MDNEKIAFVSIYCKIYTENFSNDMIGREATGTEIYDFLMRDAGMYMDENAKHLPGDANIWYLGTNEKRGNLIYQNKTWSWGYGESSFDIVSEFVQAIYDDGFFT